MENFGFSENTDTYNKLIASYSEKHRAYHTLEHIDACFRHFDAVDQTSNYPHEIELALWFHDIVYAPFSKTNEEDSANLVKTFLSENRTDEKISDRVHGLVILTKDHIAPQSYDAKLMLDIDLSILGAQKHIYEQFEKDVRREYKRVPTFIFNKKRKEILKSFAGRSRLYHTDYFFDSLETQAKDNLYWAIDKL